MGDCLNKVFVPSCLPPALIIPRIITRRGDYPPDVEGAIIQADLLTFTEKRVLRAFFRHDRVKEVAEELYIASDTVKKHLKHIYQKLGVYSSHRALVKAMELGLLGDGDGDSIKG